MPLNNSNKSSKKLYYSIGEVAKMFGVNASLIRFWEKEFAIIKPTKNKKGNRLFTQKDISNFEIIYQLVKEEGYTLDGAKQRLKKKKNYTSREKQEKVVESLQELRNKLVQLSEHL